MKKFIIVLVRFIIEKILYVMYGFIVIWSYISFDFKKDLLDRGKS